MAFDNLGDLFKEITKQVKESLHTDVSEKVKEVEKRHVGSDVFNKYDPFVYERRKKGGLDDVSNMVSDTEVIGDQIILSVVNNTRGSDEPDLYIAPLVEYGDNNGYGEYMYKFNRDHTEYKFLAPRPFTEETINELAITKEHEKVLKDSLKSKGFKF